MERMGAVGGRCVCGSGWQHGGGENGTTELYKVYFFFSNGRRPTGFGLVLWGREYVKEAAGGAEGRPLPGVDGLVPPVISPLCRHVAAPIPEACLLYPSDAPDE